ncbi:hypothetical protein DM01DRAFT_1080243 [Hesseltinella vesiculosa]|uniref:Uncharacterized protein n=1 Tax=Hesseltinella vesiculosa TaxID=101127 RepID=A0A1X2GDV8_9FUNG|nr:hypothetical protein DM01DRAFT_1080243 [Hesseltinella vesiculosa]
MSGSLAEGKWKVTLGTYSDFMMMLAITTLCYSMTFSSTLLRNTRSIFEQINKNECFRCVYLASCRKLGLADHLTRVLQNQAM